MPLTLSELSAMPNTWARTSIEELLARKALELSDGYRTRHDQLAPSGIPILRAADVLDGTLVPSFKDHVACTYRPKMGLKISRPDDVVITTKGTVGRVARVPISFAEHVYSPQLCFLRSMDVGVIDPGWLYGWARAPEFTRQLGIHKDQTDMAPYISLRDLRRFQITLPPVQDQRRIAGVLGALDDIIDTNKRIADDCTSLWRILLNNALDNAPGTRPLSDLAAFVNGKNFTKDASGHGRPVIRTPEVRRGPEPATPRSDVEAAEDNVAREGDILFVWSGSLTVGRWMWEEGLINQHVFKVLPKPGMPAWLIFGLIERQMRWFLSLAADKATTMGHIKREHLDADAPVPSAADIDRLDPIIDPLWNEALQCGVAIHQLAMARDELLPLLMSGRVHVGEVAA